MTYLEELLITFLYSKRAQLAVILGPVFFAGIMLIGHYLTRNLMLDGVMAPLSETFRTIYMIRYEHAAWGVLLTFWVLAGKTLIKDRKKYLY